MTLSAVPLPRRADEPGSPGRRALELVDVEAAGHRVRYTFAVDGRPYAASVWYHSVDLDALRADLGSEAFDRAVLHVALFDLNRGLSAAPGEVVLPEHLARLVPPELAGLWGLVADHVWAQWRYENGLPGYRAPALPVGAAEVVPVTAAVPGAPVRPLVMCGGGKDSLAVLQLLDEAGIDYTTLGYSSSTYGTAARQHELIEAVALGGRRSEGHVRVSHLDDLEDSPYLELDGPPGISTATAAETPFSVFLALPVMLAGGYTHLVVGHERSADVPNLVWDGEPVNHQWGKSSAAERALDAYLGALTGSRCSYVSLLSGLSDPLIFGVVERAGDGFGRTHSCNVDKPWCLRCPKCLYVWMSARAYLSPEACSAAFGDVDLFADPSLDGSFEALLGLGEHTPFECIGSAAESRLAALTCRRAGRGGPVLDRLAEWLEESVADDDTRGLLSVDASAHRFPATWLPLLAPVLADVEAAVRARVAATAGQGHPGLEADARLTGVSFVAPFDQGFTVDVPTFLARGVGAWYTAWHHGDLVEGVGPVPWQVAGAARRASRLAFDVDTYEGDTVVPRTLARLVIGTDVAGTAPAVAWVRSTLSAALGPRLAFRSATVELTPFGIGSLRLDAVPTRPVSRAEDARALAEATSSTLADALATVCADLARDALAHVEEDWYRSPTPGGQVGEALWVHRVLAVDARDDDAATRWCRQLSLHGALEPGSRRPDGALVSPGIGTSVLVDGSAGTLDDLAAVVALANGAWAAADRWSAELLKQATRVTAGRRGAGLAELRAMTEVVAETTDAAAAFRAVLHDEVAALSPCGQDCWTQVIRAWRLDELLTEVDRRRAELKSAHRETVDLLQSQLGERLNTIVLALTVLSGLSVVAAMIDYAFGGPLTAVDGGRSTLFVAAAGLLGAGLLALWRRRRPARDAARRRP